MVASVERKRGKGSLLSGLQIGCARCQRKGSGIRQAEAQRHLPVPPRPQLWEGRMLRRTKSDTRLTCAFLTKDPSIVGRVAGNHSAEHPCSARPLAGGSIRHCRTPCQAALSAKQNLAPIATERQKPGQ